MSETIWARSAFYLTDYIYLDDEILIIKQLPGYTYLAVISTITLLLWLRALSSVSGKNMLTNPLNFYTFAFGSLFLAFLFSFPVVYFLSYAKRRSLRSKKSIDEIRERSSAAISWQKIKKIDCRNGSMTIYLENSKKRKILFGRFSSARRVEELVRSKSNFPWRIRKVRMKTVIIGYLCAVTFFVFSLISVYVTQGAGWFILASFVLLFSGLGLLIYGTINPKVETNDSEAWKTGAEAWLYKKTLREFDAERDLIGGLEKNQAMYSESGDDKEQESN